MANNYAESSSMFSIDGEKAEKALNALDPEINKESLTPELLKFREAVELQFEDNWAYDPDEGVDEILGKIGYYMATEKSGIWIKGDGESFDEEVVMVVIQNIMKLYDMKEPFGFSISFSCSKQRLDEFGGGWVVVTKDKIYSGSTFSAIQSKIDELKNATPGEKDDTK